MNIPSHLKNCPIVDFTCDVRFESSFPPSIVTGMMVAALSSLNIETVEGLPILQIPEALRDSDENLKFAPHYKTILNGLTLQFGGGVIAVSAPMPYQGWATFKPEIEKIFGCLFEHSAGLLTNITRIGQRTINFFEDDILQNTLYTVNSPINYEKQQYHYLDYYRDGDDLSVRIIIANQANYQTLIGSVIDVDAHIDCKNTSSKPELCYLMGAMERSHTESKKVFFKLLKNEFIEQLGAEYDA
jgi:uncharacterized protein (TIGR04255 family)